MAKKNCLDKIGLPENIRAQIVSQRAVYKKQGFTEKESDVLTAKALQETALDELHNVYNRLKLPGYDSPITRNFTESISTNLSKPKEQKTETAVPESTEPVGQENAGSSTTVLNKNNKAVFTTKSGNQNVEFKDGDLVVTNAKDGKPVSVPTERKAIREYADNFDFSVGQEGDGQSLQEVIDNSENPYQLADIYTNEEPTTQPLNTVERMIADYGIGKTTNASFTRFGDRNNITQSLSKSYLVGQFSKEGVPLDSTAKEMTDHYGVEISPGDLIDFMVRFPNGASQALKLVESEVAQLAAQKFQKLTGLTLNNEIAAKAINQQFDKLSKQEQQLAEQDYETRQQLESAYWEAYRETDGFTKENSNNKAEQGSESKSIAEKGKQLADLIRKLRPSTNTAQSTIFAIPIAIYDTAIITIANAIEGGATLAQAIKDGIDFIKQSVENFDESGFTKAITDASEGKKPNLKVQVGITDDLKEYADDFIKYLQNKNPNVTADEVIAELEKEKGTEFDEQEETELYDYVGSKFNPEPQQNQSSSAKLTEVDKQVLFDVLNKPIDSTVYPTFFDMNKVQKQQTAETQEAGQNRVALDGNYVSAHLQDLKSISLSNARVIADALGKDWKAKTIQFFEENPNAGNIAQVSGLLNVVSTDIFNEIKRSRNGTKISELKNQQSRVDAITYQTARSASLALNQRRLYQEFAQGKPIKNILSEIILTPEQQSTKQGAEEALKQKFDDDELNRKKTKTAAPKKDQSQKAAKKSKPTESEKEDLVAKGQEAAQETDEEGNVKIVTLKDKIAQANEALKGFKC